MHIYIYIYTPMLIMYIESYKESPPPSKETIRQNWAPGVARDGSSDEIGPDSLQGIPAALLSLGPFRALQGSLPLYG